ncbi:hypothetical protein LTR72_005304 [Exophiala xenobiotica]|nr:hypothetical protein LTR92_003510 [Exophiala xenobiotica]KAK5223918.1 hypothetical protein LTR72_005304 [Exophiala xenobiotica]KAK5289318.1 hypothetical protein LTR14_007569 [Exophiala xenobiotica]KAK5323391.1 hypothetical protein LTR93_005444 [Exophiala xenobiotica]KAK5441072.1 hypothetical protein LTR18_006916 [Exophiala xenobiotica]
MAGYDTIPQGANIKVDKFTLSISDEELSDFKTLLRLSKLAPQTYENLHTDDGTFGVSHEWMSKAKEYWLNEYDWRTVETYNNSFPNYIAHIKDDDGEEFRIHFAALFSKRDNAIPLLYMHGWPGSHFEFLDILTLYREKYSSPEDLPYHIIAVSLPGWTLSSGPPLTKDFGMEDIGRIMNKLILGLGFGSGYVLQGGDIGSFTAAIMSGTYDECKDNFAASSTKPAGLDESQYTEEEKIGMETRAKAFYTTGNAYAREHATRPATIGFALSASPLALLAWIGEKFIEWTDETPPLKNILDSVTLYWFTQSFPRCIYAYREAAAQGLPHGNPKYANDKPVAYSWFPKEVFPVPKAWILAQGLNVVLFRRHEIGGHFAVMEKPREMMQDMEDFLEKIGWPLKK